MTAAEWYFLTNVILVMIGCAAFVVSSVRRSTERQIETLVNYTADEVAVLRRRVRKLETVNELRDQGHVVKKEASAS